MHNLYIFYMNILYLSINGDVEMDIFEKLITAIIFLSIGAVVLFAIFPSIMSSGASVVNNASYVTNFPSTVTILKIVPLIVVAVIIVLFVKFFND